MSGSELLFYAGIAVMAVSAVSAAVSTAIFVHRKNKLKKILEQEYGDIGK